MAFVEKATYYIGSGVAYEQTPDYDTLSTATWNFNQFLSLTSPSFATYNFKLITDITDDASVYISNYSGPSGAQPFTISISSYLPTEKKTITSATPGEDVLYIDIVGNDVSDRVGAVISNIIIDGLDTTGNGLSIAQSAMYGNTITINNVMVTRGNTYGFELLACDRPIVLNNVIAYNNFQDGIYISDSCGLDGEVRIKNATIVKNGERGIIGDSNFAITVTINNCLSLGNNTKEAIGPLDYDLSTVAIGASSDRIISSDDSANDYGLVNTVVGATDYTSYFRDWAGDDYHLASNSLSLWGMEANLATSPVEDFDGVTRS